MKTSSNVAADSKGKGSVVHPLIEEFGPEDARDLYENFTTEKWALKALGELLASSDMKGFCGNDYEASECRVGLSQIINLYLNNQERQIQALWQKATYSPEYLIKFAEERLEMIKQGAYKSHVELEKIAEELSKMEAIIARFGVEEYPRAVKVRDNLLKLRDSIIKE